ncbi:hypothetical protein BC936DRAFT_148124 [Jimgerdemannia flammicorona]|uniref:Uncharacterized protein n=1 Tax=Jimgerdemannia flammicorona TaxID=994334 RepID=A0A433DKW9_9FUNG|nr:hypothetical protein BC936DRAFT_148124 [Jimgerdemannia flammicorona]
MENYRRQQISLPNRPSRSFRTALWRSIVTAIKIVDSPSSATQDSMHLFPELDDLVCAVLQDHLSASNPAASAVDHTNGGHDMSWPALCEELLKPESTAPPTSTPDDFDPLSHLRLYLASATTTTSSRFAVGALQRPLYLSVAETLRGCFGRCGAWPVEVAGSGVTLLADVNVARLKEIEEEMVRLVALYTNPASDLTAKQNLLQTFFFTTLHPPDIRPFLHLRTTTGSRLARMPPTLNECLVSFTTVHERKNFQPVRKGVKPSTLTVGAKALTKHWHRDVGSGFWGVATGSERAKNETANAVLAKILTDPAWINLHWLPHDITAYEIRNAQGYGARWEVRESGSSFGTASVLPTANPASTAADVLTATTDLVEETEERWTFRGFLEPQMVGGHEKGWVH